MYTVLIVFQVLVAAALVAIVLVQRGPGATMGAAFGSGASGTVFGSRGATGFLTKLTSWLGVAFFGISLTMAVMVARSGNVGQPVDDLGVAGQLDQPAVQQGEEAVAGDAVATPEAEDDDEFLDVPIEEEAAEGDQSDAGEEPPPAG